LRPEHVQQLHKQKTTVAVDTVINVKVILIGLTSEVKRPPLA
jgi:hypothetical protein